jgi:hypothetical protein
VALTASTALRGFTSTQSSTKATTSRATANSRAWPGSISPVTSGRPRVRVITLSMSRSAYMLMALAPPAARAPPTRVATTSHTGGSPRAATTMVGRVVTSSSSMIRGLVRAR